MSMKQDFTQYLRVHTEQSSDADTNKQKTKNWRNEKREYWYDRWLPGYLYQYYLVFDTETTTDERQDLRFGTYELHGKSTHELFDHFSIEQNPQELPDTLCDELIEAGIFYNPDMLTGDEILLIQDYAIEHSLRCITRDEFLDLFYAYAHHNEWYTLVIGHNLPFDLSRFCREWQEAKGQFDNGFSMKLCSCMWECHDTGKNKRKKRYLGDSCRKHPNVKIKKIAKNIHLYEFADKKPKGNFLDTQTFARALLGPGSTSLHNLGKTLGIEHQKTFRR